jgi:hypothetical protein
MQHHLIKAIIITTLCAAFAGCATNSDLAEVRKLAEEAKAQAATADANSQQALQMAGEAKQAAFEANLKINRAFQKATQK